jgi:hypothetical protein
LAQAVSSSTCHSSLTVVSQRYRSGITVVTHCRHPPPHFLSSHVQSPICLRPSQPVSGTPPAQPRAGLPMPQP